MSGARNAVVTSLGLHLDDRAPVDLRGGLETTAVLVLGGGVVLTMDEGYLRALRDEATVVLGDMAQIEAADQVVEAAGHAGAQARRIATLTRGQADAAKAAGAPAEAARAYEAAARAADAAETAQIAVGAASEAMVRADEAAESARLAGARAAGAAGGAVTEVLRLV
ncbi:hypothetical protein [Actinosynnema sp. NPDC020468]|uniref:hypothetical protein n=1 Tax=Actinosynnema sp. NPDC020468 TaxID=3154488 RepID=UPI0033F19CAC